MSEFIEWISVDLTSETSYEVMGGVANRIVSSYVNRFLPWWVDVIGHLAGRKAQDILRGFLFLKFIRVLIWLHYSLTSNILAVQSI